MNDFLQDIDPCVLQLATVQDQHPDALLAASGHGCHHFSETNSTKYDMGRFIVQSLKQSLFTSSSLASTKQVPFCLCRPEQCLKSQPSERRSSSSSTRCFLGLLFSISWKTKRVVRVVVARSKDPWYWPDWDDARSGFWDVDWAGLSWLKVKVKEGTLDIQ